GHDAQLDLGLAELGRIGGDDEVAHHGKFAAAAEGKARNGGDHRLAATRDPVPGADEVPKVDVHVGLRLHLLDVGAGGKGFFGSGNDHATDAVVRLPRIERL